MISDKCSGRDTDGGSDGDGGNELKTKEEQNKINNSWMLAVSCEVEISKIRYLSVCVYQPALFQCKMETK